MGSAASHACSFGWGDRPDLGASRDAGPGSVRRGPHLKSERGRCLPPRLRRRAQRERQAPRALRDLARRAGRGDREDLEAGPCGRPGAGCPWPASPSASSRRRGRCCSARCRAAGSTFSPASLTALAVRTVSEPVELPDAPAGAAHLDRRDAPLHLHRAAADGHRRVRCRRRAEAWRSACGRRPRSRRGCRAARRRRRPSRCRRRRGPGRPSCRGR